MWMHEYFSSLSILQSWKEPSENVHRNSATNFGITQDFQCQKKKLSIFFSHFFFQSKQAIGTYKIQ